MQLCFIIGFDSEVLPWPYLHKFGIKTLFFKDWPQEEIYPASIEDFVRRIYDASFLIFDSINGDSPCDHED